MGKISVVIPDELERELRKIAFEKMGGKKGALSVIIQEALERYIASIKTSGKHT